MSRRSCGTTSTGGWLSGPSSGYAGLAVAIAGLIVMSLGSTPWVLATGVFIWLVAAAVTLAGFFWSPSTSFPSHDLDTGR